MTGVTLRDYQLEAVNAVSYALREHRYALIQAATGAGKSLIAAEIARRSIERNPSFRILILCYVREILESNDRACRSLGLNSGIYCAGLNRREKTAQVIHASRDSLARDPAVCGKFDLVVIDEAHMLSKDQDSRYQKIIGTLNPRWLIGMTATPYRLTTGLIYGVRRMFPKLAYKISHKSLVDSGWLVPYCVGLVSECIFNQAAVKLTRGEFDSVEVEGMLVNREKVLQALNIWLRLAKGRRLSLFFCHSIEHAKLCYAEFTRALPERRFAVLDHTTDSDKRMDIVNGMRASQYDAVFQVQTMTTGIDVPAIDCIVWFRPTMSTSLFVQGCGRGSRLSPGKTDCLVIDLVGNLERFGNNIYEPLVSDPLPSKKKIEFSAEELTAMGIDPQHMKGELPTKSCTNCHATVAVAARKCDGCGYLFVAMRSMTTGQFVVESMTIDYARTQSEEPCMIIKYKTTCGRTFTEWILHTQNWAKSKAQSRRAMLRHGVKSLLVIDNPKNPRFPKLIPQI